MILFQLWDYIIFFPGHHLNLGLGSLSFKLCCCFESWNEPMTLKKKLFFFQRVSWHLAPPENITIKLEDSNGIFAMAPRYSIATQSCRRHSVFAFWFYSLQQILVNNNHTRSKRCTSKNHMPIVLPESLQSSFLPESKPHKSHHINSQLRRPLKFLSHFIKASAKRKPIILLSATMTSLPPSYSPLIEYRKKKKILPSTPLSHW